MTHAAVATYGPRTSRRRSRGPAASVRVGAPSGVVEAVTLVVFSVAVPTRTGET
jgi:hypothetical protein